LLHKFWETIPYAILQHSRSRARSVKTHPLNKH
jgi:hypothetical protein